MDHPPAGQTLEGVLTWLREGRPPDRDLELRLTNAFARYSPGVAQLCRRELQGLLPADVEEVTQEVLREAFEKLSEFRRDSRFKTFLIGIARLKCANARRRKRDVLTDDGVLDTCETGRDALRRLADQERDAIITDAARAVLNEEEQSVVYLRWVYDWSRAQIAEEHGLEGPDQVRVILFRCKRKMERELTRRLAAADLLRSALD